MRKEYRSDHSTEKHSPTRTQADGHTDFSWVVPKSVQVRGDRTYANSDVNHKINKTIGSVCGYRSESSRKICPFPLPFNASNREDDTIFLLTQLFRPQHRPPEFVWDIHDAFAWPSCSFRVYTTYRNAAFPDLCRQQNWMYFFIAVTCTFISR